MDKKIAALLGAAAGVATVGAAQAATAPASNTPDALQASSYADLLAPVPNAVEVLRADDAAREKADVQLAQYYSYPYPPPYYYYHHHHHHHHHNFWRRSYHHHHHHHHHHWWGYY